MIITQTEQPKELITYVYITYKRNKPFSIQFKQVDERILLGSISDIMVNSQQIISDIEKEFTNKNCKIHSIEFFNYENILAKVEY